MPPPSRNHRTPTAGDTPASTPAASLVSPRAIAAQNAADAPYATPAAAPANASELSSHDPKLVFSCPPQLLSLKVLRRPLESAQYVSFDYTQTLTGLPQLVGI
jgi:hypothetical protein